MKINDVSLDSLYCPIDKLEVIESMASSRSVAERHLPFLRSNGLVNDHSIFYRNLSAPSVIFCHDMRGGYLKYDEDVNIIDEFPSYRFINWDLIDIYVYFSHHLVTIPPFAWINLAHKNNVRVYGTFIVESAENDVFQRVFCQKTSDKCILTPSDLAYALDNIRRKCGFEGWLINIEVVFTKGFERQSFNRMLDFLQCLKACGSEVIWYDAVTRTGKLAWQNALTEENMDFFRVSDGIFLNYCWTPELLNSSQLITRDANESKKVFVGVDCFGRGCPGNGGFNTNVALDLIIKASEKNPDRPLSVALFAPAWSFEKCDLLANILPTSSTRENSIRLANLHSILDNQFWAPLRESLSRLRGIGSDSSGHLRRPFIPTSTHGFIIKTDCSFGQGFSNESLTDHFESYTPWGCLNNQEVLPNCHLVTPSLPRERETGKPFTNLSLQSRAEYSDYFASGSCLRVSLISDNTTTMPAECFIELFLFPNLSLSFNAKLLICIRCDPLDALRMLIASEDIDIFVDFCETITDSIFSTDQFPVTHRRFLKPTSVKTVHRKLSNWLSLDFCNLGEQLTPTSPDSLYLLRPLSLGIIRPLVPRVLLRCFVDNCTSAPMSLSATASERLPTGSAAANRLLFHVPRLPKKLRRGEGLGGGSTGRLSWLRRCVSALVEQERIELPWPIATESRQYMERLIQEAIRTELLTGDLSKTRQLEDLFEAPWCQYPELSAFLELSAFWLQRPELITKLLKVLVPRYRFYTRPYTQLYRLQRPPHPDAHAYIAEGFGVLELHGNPWPPIGKPHLPKPKLNAAYPHQVSIEPFKHRYFINVLVNAAREANRSKQKSTKVEADN